MHNSLIKQINAIIKDTPKVCLILGSGLGDFPDILENKKSILYSDISGFLETSVSGHVGQFIFGYLHKTPILCARGRFHYYEGFSFNDVGIIVEIFNYYRPNKIIITNSVGCLRLDWKIGDFININQFIDFSFISSNQIEKYYLDENETDLKNGTYAYTIGPTYETKSEIQEIISNGGDVVGMSTFPEYLMCKKLSIEPIIISCLTNYGAGLIDEKVRHEDVLTSASKANNKFNYLIDRIIQNIAHHKIPKK